MATVIVSHIINSHIHVLHIHYKSCILLITPITSLNVTVMFFAQ